MLSPAWLLLFALGLPGLTLYDLDGVPRQPMTVHPGSLHAIFFVTADCPVSNSFAPEIRRICERYASRGLTCTVAYVDPTLPPQVVRDHARQYGVDRYPVVIDGRHQLVHATAATTTPEAFLIGPGGSILYRGLIDDSVKILGQSRGPKRHAYLQDAIESALAGEPVLVARTRPVGCYIPDLRVLETTYKENQTK